MIKRSCLCAALMLALAGTSPVLAQSEARHAVEVEAQDLGTALRLLAQQTRLQIVYSADLVQGKRAPALDGSLTAREALERVLAGSGLEYEFLDSQTVTLSRVGVTARAPSGEVGQPNAVDTSVEAEGEGADAAPPEPTRGDRLQFDAGNARAQDLETITVTGTRIRGGNTPSPVITISSEHIREEGFTDLGEVIRSLPQNFSGGQNPGVLMGNVTGNMINQNVTGGSGLNLRGLGPDASLTLLNGRRMSYGGFVQAVDISAIPVEAVERVEIVADGASAIYGSDAVGGVGNVVLKRDFDGVAIGGRYGAATDGGMTTREYDATTGAAWGRGGLIATYRNVSADPIYARQRNYTAHLPHPSMIYPDSDLRSGLLSIHQEIGGMVELQLDALRTEREQLYYFFSTDAIYNRLATETRTTYISPSMDFILPGSWIVSVGGAWGEDDLISDHSRLVVGTAQVSPLIEECFCNASRSYDVSAEGPLFPIGGGDVRVALGAGRRTNEFLWHNRIMDVSPSDGRESSRFMYVEASLPFVRSEMNVAGTRRLELTAAVRSEDYDSFGRVSTPKLGLIYDPNAHVTLKASWGKSFKAPTLLERYRPMVGVAIHPSAFGGTGYAEDDILLFLNGGNPDLKPERARTWLASVALHPAAVPGLDVELTWFDIDYTDRVVQPLTGPGYFTDPANAEYLDLSPTSGRLEELLAAVDSLSNYTTSEFESERVVAVLDGRYVNTVWQKVRGMDLAGSYRFRLGSGQMTVRGSASWLDSSRQTAGMAYPLDLAGTLSYPAKVNGRAGVVWVNGGFSASAFTNYTGPVSNPSGGDDGASFTTLDATLRYGVERLGSGWNGLEFVLAATNLFDLAPPLHVPDYSFVAPYDSTNYPAIGRFVNFSVKKRW